MANSTQLLILGNGFDLHCGLHSSYNDFFRAMILDTVGERFGLKQMKDGVSGFWEGLLLEYYKVNVDKDYKWCDIESIIQNTVLHIKQKLWSTILCGYNNNQDPAKFYSGTDPIIVYVLRYCVRFLFKNLEKSNRYSDRHMRQLLFNNLLQELHNLEKRFCNYLKDNLINPQSGQLNEQYLVNAVNLLEKLTEFTNKRYTNIGEIVLCPEGSSCSLYKGYKLANEFSNLQDIHVLNFNYTALFDILLVDAPCSYNNVHGKLCNNRCDGCKSSNVIFGVDDSLIQSQTENSELRLFSKTYRKMLDTAAPTKILPANNIPVTIKFYGHSLSKADYSYFQSIFDYYNLYGNNNVDLVFYYSKGYEQTDAIYALINSYGKTLNNSDQGKNLMHKLLLENRLRIMEMD